MDARIKSGHDVRRETGLGCHLKKIRVVRVARPLDIPPASPHILATPGAVPRPFRQPSDLSAKKRKLRNEPNFLKARA
jgi:hypothetical protein